MSQISYKRIFAIGDIHGCNAELKLLLTQLPLGKDTLVVFLGDYIDRGNDSKGVIETILELKTRVPVVALRGNHEDMFLDFLNHPESVGAGMFIFNGGSATLSSYQTSPGQFEIPVEHRRFLTELKHSYATDDYFFVHAGVPNIPLSEIDPLVHGEQMMWIRSTFLNSQFDWGKRIVHGHTPVAQAEIHPNRINVDTGCVYDNCLTAVELPKLKLYSVEKQQRAEVPVFLRSPEARSRVAERFRGAFRVIVDRGKNQAEFETLNYTQFGLLIRHNTLTGDASAVLKVGEEITGMIEGKSLAIVMFRGSVVRTETRDNDILYGIKLHDISTPGDKL